MNYEKIYNNLVEKAKNRLEIPEGTFMNSHHIIPKHSGGDNSKTNLVLLTYKEHIFAHLLLYKIHNNILDLYASLLMRSKTEEAALLIKKLGGSISGKQNVLSGHLDRIRPNKEQQKINSRKAGLKNIETGFIKELTKIGNEAHKANCKFWYCGPDGNKFYCTSEGADFYNLPKSTFRTRCRKQQLGFYRTSK